MDLNWLVKFGDALRVGGPYFALALALFVVGYLFSKNQALHKEKETLQQEHAAEIKALQIEHLKTAKEVAPLASDMARIIQRTNEEVRLARKTAKALVAKREGGTDENGT